MSTKQKSLRRRLIPIFSVIGVIAVLGGLAISGAHPPARVQFAHFSPDSPAFDIYVNGVLTDAGLRFQAIGATYQVQTDGSVETLLEVRPAGAPRESAPVHVAGMVLGPGDSYVVVITNVYAGLQSAPVRIITENLSPGRGRVQVFHSLPNGPRVNVFSGSDLMVSALGYVEPPVFFEVAPGNYRFDAVDIDSGGTLFQQSLNVQAGKVYTLFVSGPPARPVLTSSGAGPQISLSGLSASFGASNGGVQVAQVQNNPPAESGGGAPPQANAQSENNSNPPAQSNNNSSNPPADNGAGAPPADNNGAAPTTDNNVGGGPAEEASPTPENNTGSGGDNSGGQGGNNGASSPTPTSTTASGGGTGGTGGSGQATPTSSPTPILSSPTATPQPSPTPVSSGGGAPGGAIFASPNGASSGSCTEAVPCNLNTALGRAQAGSTVVLLAGQYGRVNIDRSGAAGQPITIQAAPGTRPVIDGGGQGGQNPVTINGDWVVFAGIEVRNSGQHGIEVVGDNVVLSGVYVHDIRSHGILVRSQGARVENSLIERAVMENQNGGSTSGFSSGLKCAMGCVDVVFSGNTVRDNWGENIAVTRGVNVTVVGNTVGNGFAPGIYIDNSYNVTVQGNTVHCTAAMAGAGLPAGIQLGEEVYSGWGAQLHDVVVSGNRVETCRNGFVFWGSDVGDSVLRNITVQNNTFVLTTHTGIYLTGTAQNVTVTGNTIIQANGAYYYGPSGVTYSNNTQRTSP